MKRATSDELNGKEVKSWTQDLHDQKVMSEEAM